MNRNRSRRVPVCLTLLTAALLLTSAPGLVAQQVDLLLHNGKILTVDANFSTAQAVAITGNRITAVGRDADILPLAGPRTTKLDLKGRTVVPGLIDTHLHITGPGDYMEPLPPERLRNYSIDWRGVSKKEDVLNQIRGLMAKYKPPKGEWIAFSNQLSFSGVGGDIAPRKNQAKILYDEMTRYDLDQVMSDNPAMLTMGVPDENLLFVNSAAIDILWGRHGDFIRKYGRYWIDNSARPDGHLEPPATRLMLNLYAPKLLPTDMAPGIQKLLEELSAQGHTTISTKIRVNGSDAYKLLEKQGTQPVRLGYGAGWDFFGSVESMDQLQQFANQIGTGTDINWITSVAPSSVDGASTRACTNQKRDREFGPIDQWFPLGQCHTDGEYRGGSNRPANIAGNYFQDWIMAMPKYNLRLANDHVAGDRSVANLLGMIERLQAQYGADGTKNWAFDHCTLVDPKDFARAAKLGVMFSCAPKYIQSVAPNAAESYGPQVANTFVVPVASLIKAGARVVYEADRDTYVWEDLELFLTRKDEKGKVWGPQEKLDKVTTLKTVTRWAAEYVLKPDKIGSIEVGKLADLAVLDRDYLNTPDEQVSDIKALLTVMDGKVRFVDTNFSAEYNLKPTGAVVGTFESLKARRPAERVEGMVGEGGG
jgi:predicted amidohydrolase YtcJ